MAAPSTRRGTAACGIDESLLQGFVGSRWCDPKHSVINHTTVVSGHLENLILYL